MSTEPGHDDHGHDDHGHDDHGHDDHGHDEHAAHAASAPVEPAPAPTTPPPNPATRAIEVRVLQTAFHLEPRTQIRAMLPADATPRVIDEIDRFLAERQKHLAFWSGEEQKAAASAAARIAARKAAAGKPAAKH